MKFSPVYPTDFKRLQAYTRNQPHEICVYSLPCALVWRNDQYHPLAAEWEGMLLVAGNYPETPHKNHLILPFAPQGPEMDPGMLRDIARKAGFRQYGSVPQAYLDYYTPEKIAAWFEISRQEELDDYVYRQSDLAELRGNRYAKKRNLINQFQRDYLTHNRVTIETIDSTNQLECLDFLEEWCAERDCSPEGNLELACEKEAARQMLTYIEEMAVTGLLARVDGRVRAFAVGARLTATMGVLHFEKALSVYKGLYQYFDRECARRLFADVEYINKESDMGEPGLAKSKKSYHPVGQVRAYQLQLKD